MHRFVCTDADGKPVVVVEISDEFIRESMAEYCKKTAEALTSETGEVFFGPQVRPEHIQTEGEAECHGQS